jgi:excisionase family DNA binding protein
VVKICLHALDGKEISMAADMKAQLLGDGLDKVAEVAKFFRLSVAQVYVMMQRGDLPFIQVGKCRRIPHRAVLDFAARNMKNVEVVEGNKD